MGLGDQNWERIRNWIIRGMYRRRLKSLYELFWCSLSSVSLTHTHTHVRRMCLRYRLLIHMDCTYSTVFPRGIFCEHTACVSVCFKNVEYARILKMCVLRYEKCVRRLSRENWNSGSNSSGGGMENRIHFEWGAAESNSRSNSFSGCFFLGAASTTRKKCHRKKWWTEINTHTQYSYA